MDFVWGMSLRDMEHSRWTVAKLLQSEEDYYKWEFSLALVRAIRRADLNMVQWILNHFSKCLVEREVVEEAASEGHLWVLQLLEDDDSHGGIEWGRKCLNKAAKSGHWDVVRWLYQRIGVSNSEDDRYRDKIADYAFYQCNLKHLKWAIANGSELSEYLSVDKWDFSKREGRWKVVRYVLSEGHGNTVNLLNRAAEAVAKVGDLEFTKWLVTHYVPGRDDFEKPFAGALEAAGRFGHVAILECLLTHMKTQDITHKPSKAMFQVTKYGKLDVVKWLVNHYSGDLTVDLFMGLCYRQYATRTMSPNTVMDVAASHGHLEILQFLHQVDASQRNKRKQEDRDMYPTRNNCRRCTDKAMDLAAANGHREVVKWLHANRKEGCTTFAMSEAAANGHLEVVQWLHANRSEGCYSKVLDRVASGYYRVSSCCSNRLLPREYYEPNLLVKNQLPIVQWLHSNRSEGCTAEAMDGAAANGNFEMVKWLHENTTVGCTYREMDTAAGRGRLDMVKWLHEQLLEGRASTAMEYAAACYSTYRRSSI